MKLKKNPKTLPQNTVCHNCQTTLQDWYCHKCGQKYVDLDPSIWVMFTEWFSTKFGIDGAMWQTIKVLLFVPGQLTLNYIQGKRISYIHPVRLLFTLAIIFILLSQIFKINYVTFNPIINNDSFRVNPEFGFQRNVSCEIKDKKYNEKWIQFQKEFQEELKQDREKELEEAEKFKTNEKAGFFSSENIEEAIFNNISKLLSDNCYLNNQVMGSIINFLWILTPIFALVMWVIFRKSKKGYLVHFIHSLHLHSNLLLVLIISIIGFVSTNLFSKQAQLLSCMIVAINYFVSLKKIYQNNWLKTLIKGIIIIFLYTVIFIFIAANVWVIWVVGAADYYASTTHIIDSFSLFVVAIVCSWFAWYLISSNLLK